jgi:hypothetical protein
MFFEHADHYVSLTWIGPRTVAASRGSKYRDVTPMLFILVGPRNPRSVHLVGLYLSTSKVFLITLGYCCAMANASPVLIGRYNSIVRITSVTVSASRASSCLFRLMPRDALRSDDVHHQEYPLAMTISQALFCDSLLIFNRMLNIYRSCFTSRYHYQDRDQLR